MDGAPVPPVPVGRGAGRSRLRFSRSNLPLLHGVCFNAVRRSAKAWLRSTDVPRPVWLAAGDVEKVILANNNGMINGRIWYTGHPKVHLNRQINDTFFRLLTRVIL